MSEGIHSHETGLARLALALCYSVLIITDVDKEEECGPVSELV